MEVLSLESCIGRKAADDVVENVQAFIRKVDTEFPRRKLVSEPSEWETFSGSSAGAGSGPTPSTVEGVLQHLGILDCIEKFNAEGYEFRDLPIAEPDDLEGKRGIGLTAEQTRRIVTYFRPTHPKYASCGESEDDQRVAEKTQLVVEAVPLSFDQEIRNAVKSINMGLLPRDIAIQVGKNCDNRELRSLSQVNQKWKADCEEERSTRRDAEKARLVNELEGLRIKCSPGYNVDSILKMNPSEEIEHYLNGFDRRMYEWMLAFYIRVDGAVQQQIEKFARKLAQHRATYPRASPHRRGQQETMSKFDAFIRMRDNIMKILQNRMLKDHIMFDRKIVRDNLSTERSAMIQTMKIMETIGIEIGYPEVQKEQQEGTIFEFCWRNEKLQQQVQDLLVGTVNFRQLGYGHDVTRSLMKILSLESCIGRKAADDIVENVREFVRDMLHIEASSLTETDFSRRKLVNELERLCTIAQQASGMSPDFMKDASEEIEHYLNGFDSRMSSAMGIFHSKLCGAVQREIEKFVINLAQHRATYPRPPPHRLGDQRESREMPEFDAFIKMREDNMKILQNRMRDDYIMYDVHCGAPLYWERQAVMEVMWIMETIGFVIDYPGVQEMMRVPGLLDNAHQEARDFLHGTDDFFARECGNWTVMKVLSRASCIGVTETQLIMQNMEKFVEVWRRLWRRLV